MDVSQEQVDALVLFLEQCGPGCGYVLSKGRVLIVKVVPFQTQHDEAVLHKAVNQKKLRKGKLSDLGTAMGHTLSDEECYFLTES